MPLGIQFTSWVEYYDSLPTGSIVNKGKLEQMLKSFDSSLSPDEAKRSMTRNKDLVFLARTGLNDSLGLFHRFETSGGTVVDPDESCAIILGLNRNNAILVTPDSDTLFKNPHATAYKVAKREDIMNCTTMDMVRALVDSDTQTTRARNFIPVPPFLINTISISIETNKGDPEAIFFEMITAIKEFDELNKEDASFTEKAAIKCKLFLHWLYVAKNNEAENGVSQIQFAPCSNESLILNARQFERVQFAQPQNHHAQVTQAMIAPLEQLAASSKTTQEAVLRMTTIQEKDSSSEEKSFAKIPASYKRMILNACSVGEAQPSKVGDEAMEFFNLSGIRQAHIHLNSLLDSKGIRVSISHAATNALFCGAFKWSNLLTPSGFAASVLESESFLRSDILREAMVLEASTKFTISDEYVEKLTKTSIQFPTSSEEVIERFKAMQEFGILFFKIESYIAQFYITLVNWSIKARRILDLRIAMDPKFIAKFIVSTDSRVNLYLDSCMSAESPMDVSHRYLDPRKLCEDIEVNAFHYNLPSSVKSVSTSQNSSGSKRKAENLPQQAERVNNSKTVEAWKLRPNENYIDIFGHKVSSGPKLSMGCFGCHKFHNKGFCYSDCANVKSHCPLKGTDFTKFNNRVKVLRGE